MHTINKIRQGKVIFSDYQPGEGVERALKMQRQDILLEIKESGLKGRGGAGFPTATKWMLTAAAKDNTKYIICNADEGEPGTFKDRVLLSEFPHLIIEGMIIAGYTIGAARGIIYLRGEYVYLLNEINQKLEEYRSRGYLGKNILDTGLEFDITIFLGAGAYVCGEETALIESIEGHRGEARNRPPFPVNAGLKNHPTCVNNVETLAAIPHIITKSAEWYKKIGTSKSKGSKLFSISGDCKYPGVYELDWGSTINEVLELVGAEKTKAVQVGGASGICLDKSHFDRKLSFEDIPTGGSIIIFDESRDMLKVLKNFMEFFDDESCGQCTPCRIGTRKLLEGVEKIERNQCSFSYVKKLKDLCGTMKLASKCGLGQSSPNSFLSILENFGDEIFSRNLGGRNGN